MTLQRHPATDANVQTLRDKFVDWNDTWIENLSGVVELAGSLWDNSSADFKDRNKKHWLGKISLMILAFRVSSLELSQ